MDIYNFFIIVLMFIFIVYILYHIYKNNLEFKLIDKKEHFDNQNIKYLTYNETADFLLKDPDNYVKNMTDIDLYARKVSSHDEYISEISKNAISFNKDEKDKLLKCTELADNFLNNYVNSVYNINGKDIANIKWIFALTNKRSKKDKIEYEEGLPHTRTDIIFLSKYVLNNNELDLTNILIHEKIHIYQRYNKELVENIIKNMGYEITRKNKNIYLLRANPDLNDNIYYDKQNNIEMLGLYKNSTPNSISDIIISNFSIEHPYEKMAYEIAEEYNKMHLNKYKNNNLL